RVHVGDVVAGLAQRTLDAQPAQRGHVVGKVGVLLVHPRAQLAHGRDREALRGARAVLAQPVVQGALDPLADRGEGPHGVVQVEGDGAYGELHAAILRNGRRPFRLATDHSSSRAQRSRPSMGESTILVHTSSGTASNRPMKPHMKPNSISASTSSSGDSAMRWPTTIGVSSWPSRVCRTRYAATGSSAWPMSSHTISPISSRPVAAM